MTAKKEHPADKARALDRAYFQAHPKVTSYLRPYIPGEAEGIAPGVAVECVAVAFVSERMTIKAAVFPGGDRKAARRDVEAQAANMRGTLARGVRA